MFYKNIAKHLFDILFALFFILCFWWLFVFIILFYLIMGQFSFFYRQKRIGRGEVTFDLIKFRTLTNKDIEPLSARTFWLGNLLRSTSLDELPQIWNIVKGEMSWIGPRPLPMEYGSLFSEEQKKRFQVRPGISGWAQVNGRHSVSWQKKFELDNYYVDRISFKLDLLILFKTIVLLLSFRKDNSLQEEKFKGN